MIVMIVIDIVIDNAMDDVWLSLSLSLSVSLGLCDCDIDIRMSNSTDRTVVCRCFVIAMNTGVVIVRPLV